MSLARFALPQAGQALIRAMSKTTHEGKGCACIAYLCTILNICPTLLPSCELCSWLAFAALGTLPTAPLLGGTFSAAAAVRVASFPCGRSKFGFRFRNATFETRFLRFTRHAHTEKEVMLAASTPASLGHQRSKCDFDWASAAITVEDVHCRHTKGSNSQHSLPGVGGRGRSPLIRAPAPRPCPRRRPSVVTEGYIRSPPLPPTGSARFRPTPGPRLYL